MSQSDDGLPSITAPWPAKDIIYVAIVAPLMLAATLEWILFFLAFNYCLLKVFIKADHWTIRIMAIIMCLAFSILRLIFLPVMFVTLPLPKQVVQYYPELMVRLLQGFAFYTFAGLLCIPWLFCVYALTINNVGRQRRIKYILDEVSAPKTVIVMPVYKEEPEVLLTAIKSVIQCDYPASCLHVFLSFDGDQEDELFLKTIESLGVPLTMASYPKSIDVSYLGARITISRFPHGGKRHCQKMTFKLIDKIYAEYLKRNDNLFILFIDSDCILDPVCIQNFMYDMELKPGSRQNMLAMTGVITSTTKKNSFITLLQDMEYIHGQLFERTVESCCGSVTCLPGALTMLRFSAFRRMAKYYFADKAEQCDDLFDFGKCHLGEDRWLTHLFMIGAKERYQIQVCTGAFCKTEAVQTYRSLLKQRRRWFLGYITNEACMLTDVRLWKKYTLLCIVRFASNTIRTTALLFSVMILSLVTTEQSIKNLPVGFIGVSLGLNWALMLFFGAKLKRFKIWLYPVMFVVNPIFNWVYMVYGIFTAGQRTWGGPRADAGAADSTKTAAEVVEEAEKHEDELNIIPETFRPAAEARKDTAVRHVPLLPDDRIEGKFAGAERLPGGWYDQHDQTPSSGYASEDEAYYKDEESQVYPSRRRRPRRRMHSRDSLDSYSSSGIPSIYMPRRVESFMDDDDRLKFEFLQQQQQGGELALPSPYGRQSSGTSRGRSRGYGRDLESSDFSAFESDGEGYESPSHAVATTSGGRVRDKLSRDRLRLPGPITSPTSASATANRSPLARASMVAEEIEMQDVGGRDGGRGGVRDTRRPSEMTTMTTTESSDDHTRRNGRRSRRRRSSGRSEGQGGHSGRRR